MAIVVIQTIYTAIDLTSDARGYFGLCIPAMWSVFALQGLDWAVQGQKSGEENRNMLVKHWDVSASYSDVFSVDAKDIIYVSPVVSH